MIRKKKPFKFTFKVFLRILIFLVIFIFLLFYLSFSIAKQKKITYNNKIDSSVLGEQSVTNMYDKLPQHIKEPLDNISKNSAIIYVEQKVEEIKEQGAQFIDNQIKEIKKSLLKVFFQNINKSIENTYDNMINEIDKE